MTNDWPSQASRVSVRTVGRVAIVRATLMCGLCLEMASVGSGLPRGHRDGLRADSAAARSVDGWGGVCWDAELGAAVRSTPAVTATTVYVGSTDGVLYALNRRTGVLRWRFNAQSPVDGSPTVGRGLIYVTARNGTAYALDETTGHLRWRHASAAGIRLAPPQGGFNFTVAPPVVADSELFVTGKDGRLYALDATHGVERWRSPLPSSVWTAPAVHGTTVYVAANDGHLYAIDRRTGRRRWDFATEGASMDLEKEGYDRRSIQSSPTVALGTVFFGSRDGNVYAVEAESGTARWKATYAPSWISGTPVVRGDTLFITTSDAKLVAALDAHTGHELWHTAVGARVFPAVTLIGSSGVVGTDAGELVAFDAATGASRWRLAVGDPVQATAALHNGVVYVGTDGGHVFAVEMGASQFPALAVFWDAAYSKERVPGGDVLREYLAARGYEVLNARALERFLSARLTDHRPSVVVFAQDVVPRSVAPTDTGTVLFRRYLDAGGKVVWFGNPPLAIARDSAGGMARDPNYGYPTDFSLERSQKVTGLDLSTLSVAGWPGTPTARGREWGLSRGSVAGLSVDTASVSEVLALTEAGQAGAWTHSYGGPRGTGFVFLGAGGVPQQSAVPLDQLADIRRAAEFGVLRRPTGTGCR